MKEKEHIEALLARYLNGYCTADEQQEFVRWVNSSPENQKTFLELKDVWDASRMPSGQTEIQLSNFYRNQFERMKKSRMLWIRYASAVAAVFVLAFAVAVLLPLTKPKSVESFQVFSVPLGSRSMVLLADGTEVTLNSGSELKYSTAFSAKKREVWLTGEGFFKVKSDKQHPFMVKTCDFEIQVTGTQFNVCTYPENQYSNATLTEGSIRLKMNGSKQVFDIQPGEKFGLNRATREYAINQTDIESEVAWKDGNFIFKKIPFPELVQRLERWYDVKLDFNSSELQRYAFTGKFKNQETIWQVLDGLKLIAPIDYRKTTFREFTILYKPKNLN